MYKNVNYLINLFFCQSLETIQSMIAKAEKISNSERYRIRDERYSGSRSDKYSKRSNSRIRNHSRSRSRSRSRERFGRYSTSNYSPQHTKRKCDYQRPKENDDYYQQDVNRSSSSSHVKKWKKDKDGDKKGETVAVTCESSETNAESISNVTEVKSIGILSEAEMNKLGARIIKAEIMGNEVCFFRFIVLDNIFCYVSSTVMI